MNEAVIVSTARTPIGKAYRGAFNATYGATMAGHVIGHAVSRAGVDPADLPEIKSAQLSSKANRRFGRRFVVTSFRWLSPEEV